MYPKNTSITQQRGFTLIEIIVTVAIIGVLVAAIGTSMSRDSDRIASLEAKQFHIVVNEVRDEAILTGHAYFLTISEGGKGFGFTSALSQGESSHQDGLLKTRNFDKAVSVKWEVFELLDPDSNDKKVLISPLGEITPFEASFIGDESRFLVYLNDQGQLEQRTERNFGF